MNFNEKVVLVTGGARGIGKAISELFHNLGATVAVAGRNLEAAEDFAKALSTESAPVKAYRCDVSQPAQVDELIKGVLADFKKIDVLVNNAGITQDGILMRMTDEAWQKVIDTNLGGGFRLIRAVARSMLKARSGSIINLASVVGLVGNPGQANYTAAKAGLIGLTKSAAKEFGARGVRVNAVAPGLIETDMTASMTDEQKKAMIGSLPLGRLGQAEDVAQAVAFLASENASYITGQVLNVCGGMVT